VAKKKERKMMKRWTILLIIIGWFSVLATAGTGDFANFNGRAISLKVLQQKLEALHGTNSRPTNLYYLCGINRIIGYVVDEANRDIILIGKVDKKLPPLYLDDFVVALRNAWGKYTELKGNTRYFSNPGCSIDPNPKTYQKLHQLWKQTEDTDEAVKQWEKICYSPQEVRVFGIPFNTRFARVMVQADYDMKRLVDGSDELSLFAFDSLMGMEFEREKVRIRKGESRSAPVNNLNRFWFCPGEYRFLEDDNMVMIERCTVKLLTEEEHLNEEGKIVGAGRANPAAKQFAGDFTGFYDDIAGERPIFRELENLFRFVALAKVLKLKSPHLKIGLNLDYLLDRYQVSKENVEAHLPGRYHVRKYEGRTMYDGGNQTFELWMPSCGGVEINHKVEPKAFLHAPYHERCFLKKMSENTIEERKSAKQMFWDIGTSKDNKYYAAVLLDSFGAVRQGHIAMVLYSPQEGNYYCSMSRDEDDKLVTKLKTKNDFEKRVKRYNWGFKIEITRDKFDAMKKEAEGLVKKDYSVNNNNCAHFVRGVLESGQLGAGKRLKRPNEYICEVLKNNEGTVFWNK
jgi:hypothetical protein